MTIQDLGSFGEFIAAIATLVTLVYLALQLRNNTRVSRFDAHLKARELVGEVGILLSDPEKAKLYRVGLTDPDALSADERTSFFMILYLMVNAVEARHEYRRVTGDPDAYQPAGDLLESLAVQPGFKRWWESASQNYNAEMHARVERCMRGEGTDPRPLF